MGFEPRPLIGPHVDCCSKRTSATPSLHLVDQWHLLCFDIAVEMLNLSLLVTESSADKLKPQWSEKCQVRGIIKVSASFDGQVPAVACSVGQLNNYPSCFHLHKLLAKQFLSHTFGQEFQFFSKRGLSLSFSGLWF
jgi:hypothetical protein